MQNAQGLCFNCSDIPLIMKLNTEDQQMNVYVYISIKSHQCVHLCSWGRKTDVNQEAKTRLQSETSGQYANSLWTLS